MKYQNLNILVFTQTNNIKLLKDLFNFRQTLKKHVDAVHRGLKPFLCDICCFATATKSSLMSHTAAVHDKLKPFQCDYCSYKSNTKRQVSYLLIFLPIFQKVKSTNQVSHELTGELNNNTLIIY